MSITIRAVGQAAKRGARRRVPTAAALVEEIDGWLPGATGEPGTVLVPRRAADGAIEVDLHPAARPLRLEVRDPGLVIATGMTVPVGPGYHTFVARLLERLGDEVEIDWAKGSDGGEVSSDPTGAFASGNRADAERGHLAWLRSALLAIRDARRQRAGGLHLATPPGVRFTVDGAVATVLGPRDDDWLERALADPRVAADVWPWVADAMDARYLLARALTWMWLEVRWRPPIGPTETAIVDDVLGTLRRAYPLDPGLAWPWHEWRELLALRGHPDPATVGLIDRAAPQVGDGPGTIGYRRRPVTIVHEGWALDLPGSFTGTRTPEEWSGGEAGRTVTLAGTPTDMTADQFIRQVAGHLGHDAIEHQDGGLVARARLSSDASSGVEVATVEGYTAIRGRGAAIRIEIDDPQDWKWALDTWRALRPA